VNNILQHELQHGVHALSVIVSFITLCSTLSLYAVFVRWSATDAVKMGHSAGLPGKCVMCGCVVK